MKVRGFLLFDIDGVIRDVSGSYRLAIQETVNHFCSWRPTLSEIDELKTEGLWNNDWDASLELIKRYLKKNKKQKFIPAFIDLVKVFNSFYFGGDPNADCNEWTGLIKNEPLLVSRDFFNELTKEGFIWGFVSGAETPSAKFLLENRLSLKDPPLLAMGDAPDKPDPSGFLKLAAQLTGCSLGDGIAPIAYLGDTVADVLTIKNARKVIPRQNFLSFGVSPPHLHKANQKSMRKIYEDQLIKAGADKIISSTKELINESFDFFSID